MRPARIAVPRQPRHKFAKKGEADSKGKLNTGRPKGSQGKFSGDLRQMILEALHAEGGTEYLRKQATENPKTFMALLARVIPLSIKQEYPIPTDEELKVMTPIDMMRWCMRYAMLDPTKIPMVLEAAAKIAPYEHPRLSQVEHRGGFSLDQLNPDQLFAFAAALREATAIESDRTSAGGNPEQEPDQGEVRDEPIRVH